MCTDKNKDSMKQILILIFVKSTEITNGQWSINHIKKYYMKVDQTQEATTGCPIHSVGKCSLTKNFLF